MAVAGVRSYSYQVDGYDTNANHRGRVGKADSVNKAAGQDVYGKQSKDIEDAVDYSWNTDVAPCSQTAGACVSDADAQGGTTFPVPFIFQYLQKYAKVLDEHYAKVNEENKKFENPEMHIYDKYYNQKSPYYEKGLTKRERDICATAEKRALSGLPPAVNSYDPVLQQTFGRGINSQREGMEYNLEVRQQISTSIRQLFEENGIEIPEGAELRLRVDPYEYRIHAEGIGEELAKKIEEVLNRGKNGRHLYEHIEWSNPGQYGYRQPKQYLYDIAYAEKAALWHFINDMTGLDVNKLENKDGTIWTPDGKELWEAVKDAYNEKREKNEIDALPIDSLYKDYLLYAKEGWGDEDVIGLTIAYKDGALYDIDTQYGYGPGQTAWMDGIRKKDDMFWDSYRRSRGKELQQEEKAAGMLESISDKGASPYEMVKNYRKDSDSGKIRQDTKATEILFEALLKKGKLVPMTNRILRLSGKSGNAFEARA